MNKEVGYIIQGFLLTVIVFAAMSVGQFLAKMPDRSIQQLTEYGTCGNDDTYSYKRPPSKNTFGAQLYKNNCAACHSITKDLTGPALAGVTKRITDRKVIYNWISNPAAILKSGNSYFVNLQKQYGGVVMIPFPELSYDEIDAILDYIEE